MVSAPLRAYARALSSWHFLHAFRFVLTRVQGLMRGVLTHGVHASKFARDQHAQHIAK
jgi:hypothetical protein